MADDVAAIQRRQRDQIEHRQHHIDQDRQLKQLGQWARRHRRRESRANPALEPCTNDRQRDDRQKGREEIADRPGDRGEYVVAHEVLEIARVHRRRLGPAERRESPARSAISGTMMVPKGSMWTMGFSETRPSILAVGSPRRLAIQACADSCTQMANSRTMISKKMSTGLKCIAVRIRYYHAGITGRADMARSYFCTSRTAPASTMALSIRSGNLKILVTPTFGYFGVM